MTKIIADSSTLYSIEEGKKIGLQVVPLNVTINNKTYKEYEEINSNEFLKLINEGHLPTSSQPSIGELVETITQNAIDDDCLILSMADGLSGSYGTACSAATMIETDKQILVLNTKTLCGPHRYVAEYACKLANEGKDIKHILFEVKNKLEGSLSFLLPQDFNYLKRGGRLTPLSASIGGLLRIQPVMTLTNDCKRLEKFKVARTFDLAIKAVIEQLKLAKINENNIIYVTHANALDQATKVKFKLMDAFPNTRIELYDLSCAFITQGGPYCIAIQTVIK